MSFIYVITNDVNGKQYVGKTNSTIEKRFRTHINDKTKRKLENRPLYKAMNKYGIEHFSIEELEECDSAIADDREQYWIDKLGTYHNGYNATLGGDGKTLYDYHQLVQKYLEFGTIKETAKFFNCDVEVVRKACLNENVKIISGQEHNRKERSKSVLMNPGNIIFVSLQDAAEYIINNGYTKAKVVKGVATHIREACLNNKKVYNHYWSFY